MYTIISVAADFRDQPRTAFMFYVAGRHQMSVPSKTVTNHNENICFMMW